MNNGTRTFDVDGLPNVRVGDKRRTEFDALGKPKPPEPIVHDMDARAMQAQAVESMEASARAYKRLNFGRSIDTL